MLSHSESTLVVRDSESIVQNYEFMFNIVNMRIAELLEERVRSVHHFEVVFSMLNTIDRQRFVEQEYFREVTPVITGEKLSVTALNHSIEAGQVAELKQPKIVDAGQGASCRPSLSECPLGCGHAHVEHPHLNMMYE